MKQFFFLSVFFLAAFLTLRLNVGAQTVSGSLGKNGGVSRGTAARGTIVIDIPAGLHVNSSRPNSQYAIATTVRVSGTGVKTSAIKYPAGHSKKFSFSESEISVYEGRKTFPFTVTVPASFQGNVVKIRAVVRYQACTNEVCYAPKTKEITLTAKVI